MVKDIKEKESIVQLIVEFNILSSLLVS